MKQQDLLMLAREVGSYDGAVRLVSKFVSPVQILSKEVTRNLRRGLKAVLPVPRWGGRRRRGRALARAASLL
jgi:hypothetical protein